jgi:hypothetical protein
MRYVGIDTYTFYDTSGRAVTVNEMREIPAYSIQLTINHTADEDFDEIASRSYVYGDGGEQDTYKLFEANIVQLLDARFDLSRIPKMVIPK